MSVLHPVGPEEPRTYWMRRAAVVAALLLVVLVAVWAFRPAADPDLEAVPASTPTSTPPTQPGAQPSSSPPPSPGPADSGTPSPTPDAGSDAPAEDEPVEDEAAAEKAAEEKAAEEKAAEEKAAEKKAEQAAAEKKEDEAEPARCDSEDLRVTLTGSDTPSLGKDHELDLSVVNGTGDTCELTVDQDSFELRIYSGTDRIWTTDQCAEWVRPTTVTLEPEQAHEWTTTWQGRRGDDDCGLDRNPLRAGTYVATAEYEEAEPVQLVMRLR